MAATGTVRGWPEGVTRWPSTAKMRSLWHSPLTLEEIAAYVRRAGDGWTEGTPTRGAVSKYAARHDFPPRRSAANTELIPWRVLKRHQSHHWRHMLDAESRRRRGGKMSHSDAKLLTEMHELLWGRGALLVFDYDQDGGWALRVREESDRNDIIRAPRRLSVLRPATQNALRDAGSDRVLAEVAFRHHVHPELLENWGRDAAADLLYALLTTAEEDERQSGAAVEVPAEVSDSGTDAAPAAPPATRRRAAGT